MRMSAKVRGGPPHSFADAPLTHLVTMCAAEEPALGYFAASFEAAELAELMAPAYREVWGDLGRYADATHLGQLPADLPTEVAYCASTLLALLAAANPSESWADQCAEHVAVLKQVSARPPHKPAKARGPKLARAPAGS